MENPRIENVESDGYELDIRKIIQTVIKNKKKILRNGAFALGLWALTFLIYAFITYSPSTYYSLVLGLNFPQAAQGKYPNGSTLSASDLVSNSVLEKVWAENGLEQRGVGYEAFQKMLTSTPYLGEINFIDTKYKGMLSQKNLSRTDIEKIEAEYRNEIQAASSKSIKLTLDGKNSKFDLTTASKLLNDVANSWSKVAIEKLGVSRSPALDGVLLNSEMKSSSPYVVVIYLNDVIYRLENVIKKMLEDSNSDTFRDPKTNLNLTGASSNVKDISKYKVDELDAFIAINKKPSEWELLQTQYKLRELQENKNALEEKAEIYRRSLVDYHTTSRYSAPSGEPRGRNSATNDAGIQLNSDAITQLLSLSAESKDADYRQAMTNKRVYELVQANDLNIRIKKLERRISMTGSKNNIFFTDTAKKEYFDLLDKTWQELESAIAVVTRIQLMSQKDFVGDSGVLFSVINQPKPYSPNKGAFSLFALISFFGFMFLGIIATSIQLYFQSSEKRFQK